MVGATKVGDWVRLRALPPWAADRPVETQRLLTHALGKTYQVVAVDQGLCLLAIGTETDRLFGGLHQHVSLEPEWLEPSTPRLNLARAPNAFGDVLHCGAYLAKTLKGVGAQHCLDDEDPLNVGPSCFEPEEHARARARFFAERELRVFGAPTDTSPPSARSTAFAERVHASSEGRPILVWVGTSLRERLFLWWLSDGLARTDFSGRELWLVAPQDWWTQAHPHLGAFSLCSGAELEALVPSAIPLDSATVRAFQECWRWFCSGAGDFPVVPRPVGWTQRWDWLLEAPAPFRFLLPGPGQLAWFDVELLSMLSLTEWQTPVSLLRPYERFQHFERLMRHFGDWAIVDRLVAWAQHPTPGVELRRLKPGHAFRACEFRLTAHGSELLSTARVQPGDAPQLELGGFRLYDPGPGAR